MTRTISAVRLAGALTAALLVGVGALAGQLLVTVGCSENVYEGTSRQTACDVGAGSGWWMPVVVPAVAVFLIVALIETRAKWIGVAVVIGIAATVEALLLAVVSSNLFA